MGSCFSQLWSDCCKKKTSDKSKEDFPQIEANYQLIEGNATEPVTNLSIVKISKSLLITKRLQDASQYYEICEKLGEGAYGTVYKVYHKLSGQMRAMKKILKSRAEKGKEKEIENEMLLLKTLDHPNIMKIYEFYEDKLYFTIINEYCDQGSLRHFMEKLRTTQMSELMTKFFMYQIMSAVTYLHTKKIIHGDIKLENIMVNSTTKKQNQPIPLSLNSELKLLYSHSSELNALQTDSGDIKYRDEIIKKSDSIISNMLNYEVKLIDFGCSKLFTKEGKEDLTGIIGTSSYCAPEVLKNSYSEKCDEWACGVLMYYLLAGNPPFVGYDDNELFNKIDNLDYSLDIPELSEVSHNAKDLISQLLIYDPNDRLSARDALSHPFFIEAFSPKQLVKDSKDVNLFRQVTKLPKKAKFQELILAYISYNFPDKIEVQKLRKLFNFLDQNSDGFIVQKELVTGLQRCNSFTEEEIKTISEVTDTDQNGYIEYGELLRCLADKKILFNESNLKAAFDVFDQNQNGKITWNEIEEILFKGTTVDNNVKKEFLAEIGKSENDYITFEDFTKIMKSLK